MSERDFPPEFPQQVPQRAENTATDGEETRPEDRIRDLLTAGADRATLKRAIDELHDADIFSVLDHLPEELEARVLEVLDVDDMVEAIDAADDEEKKEMLDELPDEKLVAIVEEMPPDEAAEALEHIDAKRVDSLLSSIDAEHADDIRGLRTFEPETAGRIMTPEYLSVALDLNASEAIAKAKESHDEEQAETVHHLLVTDSQERLIGTVTMEDLITAEPATPLRQIMDRAAICIHAERDQEVAARMMEKYDLAILPVVGDGGRLLGIITFDDIMEVLSDEASEDMYRLAGIGADEPLSEGILVRAYKRLPWLTTTLVGGLFLALIIAHYQPTIRQIAVLAAFMPIIAGLGGNVGIQSSTITVRGLATGDIEMHDILWLLRRELAMGLVIGLVAAFVLGTAAHALLGFAPGATEGVGNLFQFCAILGLSVLSGILVAATIGTLAPLACHRFGLDPAIAAGPFVTVAIDVSSQTIYLSIATALML